MVAPMRYALLVGASAFVEGNWLLALRQKPLIRVRLLRARRQQPRRFSLRSFALPIWRSMFQALKVRRH